jgi:protein TonB
LPSYRIPSASDRTPLRRRLSGLALALGVNVVLLLVLLTLGVIPVQLPKSPPSLVITFVPEQSNASAERQAPPRTQTKQAKSRPVVQRPPPIAPEKPKLPDLHPLDMIEMSEDELAAADISKLPKAGAGSGAGDSEEVGRGPNGEVLYAAEWAREPTSAELQGYLPRNAPEGSGLVACKTIPGDRVEDCIELGSDPPGSHLASAVRLAAWQFRVRPPRRGGKELVGSWVRIRIDYYRSD